MAIMFIGGGGLGKKTQTAGTRIQYLVGGFGNLFTHLLNIRVATLGTGHTMTVMKGASRAKTATALAAAGTALVVSAALTDGDGNAIAANDFIAVQLNDGTFHLTTVSAWNGSTKTATLTTAIPTGYSAPKGGKVVCYGVAGDTFHTPMAFDLTASTTNQFPAVAVDAISLARASAPGEPLMIDIDNATNASTVAYTNWGYAKT